jgi:molybdopterin/thiamine biosynthesis adenylyltransferase
MGAWWKKYPRILEAEKAALNEAKYQWHIDEDEFKAGRLAVELILPRPAGDLKLRAEYPDSYPYFPPEVFAADQIFPRHHHALQKNLCLLARGGEKWQPGRETLVQLLNEQLPTLEAVVAPDADEQMVSTAEDHVGEPLSAILPSVKNCAIIVPDETPTPECTSGRLKLLLRATAPTIEADANGILKSIADDSGRQLIGFATETPAFTVPCKGFWLRLPERPKLPNEFVNGALTKHFVDLMRSKMPTFNRAFESAKRGEQIICGFLYADEVSWKGTADDWFFISVKIDREGRGAQPTKATAKFIAADWGGEKSWMFRAPALRPLRNKTALFVGTGSLGSPVVMQLARAGIKTLYLLDYDQLQVGNTVRWALGWEYAGIEKTVALKDYIVRNYPYTQVKVIALRVGEPKSNDYESVHEVVPYVDLIIDASAAQRVNHFLADLASEYKKPYLWFSTTSGVAGGIVGRVRPAGERKGCFHCFTYALADGTIRQPADLGSPDVQPAGCAQATFIGAGVDSDEIAVAASRLAIATLSSHEDGYPDFLWDVAVVDLYREGAPILPSWTSYDLTVHASCAACTTK